MASHVLVVTGALLALAVSVSLLWQEPITALYAAIQRSGLSDDLSSLEEPEPALSPATSPRVAPAYRGDVPSWLRRELAASARELEREAGSGSALGRLRAAAADLDSVVVQGATRAPLEKGPGHYATTALPGQRGTSASPDIARPTWLRSRTSTTSPRGRGSPRRCPTRTSRTWSRGSGSPPPAPCTC